jgi:hypothetical protein
MGWLICPRKLASDDERRNTLSSNGYPQARQDGLVVRELPDEVLIYDLERHKAHCLNQTAAAVWRNCDGETSPSEIGYRLAREFSTPVDEDVVWLALEELGTLSLLDAPVVRPSTGLSRAQVLRRVGVATAAIAIPSVLSLAVPTASAAACGTVSCGSDGFCVSNQPSCPKCCSTLCQPTGTC